MSVVVAVILLIFLQGIIHIFNVYCFFHVHSLRCNILLYEILVIYVWLVSRSHHHQHSLECKHRNSNEVVPDRFSPEASSLA